MIARALMIDGEIFVILTSGVSGFPRIQLLESHRCGTPPDLAKFEAKTIVDGVTIDKFGRPLGYWFWEEDQQTSGPLKWRFVEASSLIHVFEPGRTAQYRGLTLLGPVINDLHDLDDLQLLEMRAARDAAEVTNVLKNASGSLDAGVDRARRRRAGHELDEGESRRHRGRSKSF
jgi:capsid protein